MKRYLAFVGDAYYPRSGIQDFIGDFDNIEEAENTALKYKSEISADWIVVWDSETRQDV